MELLVQIKQAGKKENQIKTAKLHIRKDPKTIKELLVYTVEATYWSFDSKIRMKEAFDASEVDSIMVLSEEQIADMSVTGKISSSILNDTKTIPLEQAIDTTLQAFEDGLIAVFIDKQRYESLSDVIALTGTEVITFVKLTMLSGRLW